MKRKVLLIPLIIFLAIAAALLWQLARNAEGDDPTNLESALIGKPVPKFRLESLDNPGQFYQADVLTQGKPWRVMPKGMIRPIWTRRSLASLCRSFVSNHWTIRGSFIRRMC